MSAACCSTLRCLSRRVSSQSARLCSPLATLPQSSPPASRFSSAAAFPFRLHLRSAASHPRQPPSRSLHSASQHTTSTQSEEASSRAERQSARVDGGAARDKRSRGLSEEELYERELAAMMARRGQQQQKTQQAAATGVEAQEEAEAVDDSDGGAADGLPEVRDFFDVEYGDWSADEDIARLRHASAEDDSRADNGGSSLHNIQIHRIIRVKEAVRDVLPDVLRQRSSLPSARVDLTSIPLLVTRVHVSSDLQWASVEWTLVPHAADSSLCRLPASMAGLSLRSLLALVSSQLTLCIAPIRRALSDALSFRYVPNVRFVYEADEWRRRRRDRRREREVEQRLSERTHSGSGGGRSVSSASEERALESELAAEEADFQRFNPFVAPTGGSSGGLQRPNSSRGAERGSGALSRVVAEQLPARERRRSRQQREQRRALDELKRTGVVNGQQRYARPVQQPQQQQQAARRGGSGGRPRHVNKDEEWIRAQQRTVWESQQ